MEMPQEDCIDEAFIRLIDKIAGEGAPEDDLDDVYDVVMDIVDDMSEKGEIEEVPDNEDSEEVKQAWLEKDFPSLEQRAIKEFEDEQGDDEVAPEEF